jgi:hypothetical protein
MFNSEWELAEKYKNGPKQDWSKPASAQEDQNNCRPLEQAK